MESRIRSMSLVHATLYQSESFAVVEFSSYVQKLCGYLIDVYSVDPNRIRLAVTADSVSLALAKAIPCGLIVNELVMNALKHAFPDGRSGTISIAMSKGEDGLVSLVVRDDGVGTAQSGQQSGHKKSVGLSIVESLVSQLRGSSTMDGAAGMRVAVTFPA